MRESPEPRREGNCPSGRGGRRGGGLEALASVRTRLPCPRGPASCELGGGGGGEWTGVSLTWGEGERSDQDTWMHRERPARSCPRRP